MISSKLVKVYDKEWKDIGETEELKKKKEASYKNNFLACVFIVGYFVNTPKSIGDAFDLFVIIETFERNHALMENRLETGYEFKKKNTVVKRICPFLCAFLTL